MRRTAVLLNDRGIPSPKGGQWHMTPLRRTLEHMADDGMIEMPQRHGKHRSPVRTPALFAALVRCHCARLMTVNAKRHQYYCAGGRLSSSHGRPSLTEKALLEVLRPEADAYVRIIRMESRAAGDELAKQRAVVERRQAALDARLDVDRIAPDAYRTATRALHQELADLHRDAAVTKTLRIDKVPDWSDVAAMNKHLKRIWTKVQLDPDMHPTAVWRDSRDRFNEEEVAAQELEYLDPEAAGLVILPVERRASAS